MSHSTQSFSSVKQLTQWKLLHWNNQLLLIEIRFAMSMICLFYQAGTILTPFERIPLYSNFIAQFFLLFAYTPLKSGSVKKVNISVYVVHKSLYNLFIHYCAYVKNLHKYEFGLILSRRGSLSYRNKSTDLQSKSMNWFLYDKDLRHERVKKHIIVIVHLP